MCYAPRMKKSLFLLIGALLFPLTASAAWQPYAASSPTPTLWYADQNAVFMNVDTPTPGAWGASADGFGGWGFDCNGWPPTVIVLRYDQTTAQYVRVMDVVVSNGLYRPDVAAAYAGLPCVVTPFSGWQVAFPSGLPKGPQAYIVELYSPGGTWNPYTGQIVPATAYRQFAVVVQ